MEKRGFRTSRSWVSSMREREREREREKERERLYAVCKMTVCKMTVCKNRYSLQDKDMNTEYKMTICKEWL